jgi:hypothetical protein
MREVRQSPSSEHAIGTDPLDELEAEEACGQIFRGIYLFISGLLVALVNLLVASGLSSGYSSASQLTAISLLFFSVIYTLPFVPYKLEGYFEVIRSSVHGVAFSRSQRELRKRCKERVRLTSAWYAIAFACLAFPSHSLLYSYLAWLLLYKCFINADEIRALRDETDRRSGNEWVRARPRVIGYRRRLKSLPVKSVEKVGRAPIAPTPKEALSFFGMLILIPLFLFPVTLSYATLAEHSKTKSSSSAGGDKGKESPGQSPKSGDGATGGTASTVQPPGGETPPAPAESTDTTYDHHCRQFASLASPPGSSRAAWDSLVGADRGDPQREINGFGWNYLGCVAELIPPHAQSGNAYFAKTKCFDALRGVIERRADGSVDVLVGSPAIAAARELDRKRLLDIRHYNVRGKGVLDGEVQAYETASGWTIYFRAQKNRSSSSKQPTDPADAQDCLGPQPAADGYVNIPANATGGWSVALDDAQDALPADSTLLPSDIRLLEFTSLAKAASWIVFCIGDIDCTLAGEDVRSRKLDLLDLFSRRNLTATPFTPDVAANAAKSRGE